MRVARVVERLPPGAGGKEKHAAELSRALAALGVDQHVFFRFGRALEEVPGSCPRYPATSQSSATTIAAFGAWCLRRVVLEHRRLPFDLIHAHGDFPEATCAAVLSRLLAVPAVLSVHGGLSRNRWHNALRLASFSSMQSLLATASSTADEIAALGVSAPTFTRPSGVDDVFFEADRVAGSPPTIIAVGHVTPVKGLEYLIAARDLVGGTRRARWLVVGEAHGEYGRRIRTKIQQRSDMTLVDARDTGEVARLLASADVFVLSSLDLSSRREGTSTALLEAIAACIPVVATDTGGTAEALGRGERGLLVPPRDAAALAAAIEKTLDDPEAARARAALARESGVAATWPDVAEDVLAHYREASQEFSRRAVLFTIPLLDVGGAERIVVDLANVCAAGGLRTGVAGAPGALADELRGPSLIPLRRGRSFPTLFYNWLALVGATVRLRPAAVNSHHFPTGFIARMATAAGRVGARHVLTVHVRERPWHALVIGSIAPYVFDRLLPVANYVLEDIQRFAPPPARRAFKVVYAGIDIPKTPASAHRDRVVGVVARLVRRKGHRVLLEAWRELVHDHVADGWTLEIWGDGPERSALVDLARTLGIDNRVFFRGTVPDANRRLSRFPIVVLPALYEGLPIVLMEAMASGCCVVASDLPGCRELVTDGTGVLVPPGDALAIRDALRDLLEHPERREEIARKGQARVIGFFTRERMVADYLTELRVAGDVDQHPAGAAPPAL
jgi:glycosyltransferase involved in cell wall biosynthesis